MATSATHKTLAESYIKDAEENFKAGSIAAVNPELLLRFAQVHATLATIPDGTTIDSDEDDRP